MEKLVLYFDTGDKLVEYILPANNNRKGILNIAKETGIPLFYLSYEVWDGIWVLKSNDYVRISQNHIVLKETILGNGEILNVKVYESNSRATISVWKLDGNHATFKKYDIRHQKKMIIGHNDHCDIQLDDRFVSAEHLVLQRDNGRWTVKDLGRNGSYLNQKRVKGTEQLNTMDCIMVSRFKILFFGDVIAINCQDEVKTHLIELDVENVMKHQKYEDQSKFSRAPRLMEPLDESVIDIEQPPSPVKKKKTPLLFILGPSLTMPIPILTMVLFNVAVNSGNGVNPLSYIGMALSVCMFAILGIGWSIMRNKYDKKMAVEEEEKRVQSYRKYISQNVVLIEEKQKKNRNILEKKYIPTHQMLIGISKDSKILWNRNVNHQDFLHVRVGTGSIENPNRINIPKERFSIEQDELALLPQNVYEKYKILVPVVKTLDLKKDKIIGVIGDSYHLQKTVNNLVLQIAMLHSYTDVRIALFEQMLGERYQLEWMKWLPHVFSDDKKVRYIADNENSKEDILYVLTQELRKRKEQLSENQTNKIQMKHFIVFSTHAGLFENENIYKYMVDNSDYHFTFILLHGSPDNLPNECKVILEYTDQCHGLYRLDQTFKESNKIRFEKIDHHDAEKFSRKISGLYINELNESAIPDQIDYFEMLGIGKIEQWDLIQHYKENRSYEGIKAWIGIGMGEHPIYLDIHEKKHGPHGLVAGTTGSGKSELIQTFLISLALNYHPDEVAFVLIDYKGGGMANTFLGMPHLAGTITNLGNGEEKEESIDDNQSRRALISIRSEIKRRQRIFNQYKVSHIDVYMRLYRENKAKEPMPHLIIISDEFAELKKEKPEFIKELVSTARVGRSLGIHLILATQKPGGVVDDEIWANSRFKLCLRVQDKQDSMGMLKRPEASELTQTGRAYMQIGNDELFEQFQSAYSGADYLSKDKANSWDEDAIAMVKLDGSTAIIKAKEKRSTEKTDTQLETAIQYVITTAKKHKIEHTKPLWLPALPTVLYLSDLEKSFPIDNSKGIMAVLGLVDDPEKQSQYSLCIDLSQINNLLIVGRASCGKTLFLQTLACSLMEHYSPDEVQFYCVDFSSRSFRIFEKMPHFGGVVLSEESEKIERLFKLLNDFIGERKSQFSNDGVGSFTEYKKLKDDLPLVLVLVDNYFEMHELYPDLEEIFLKMLREGSKYGVQFITTISHINDMRYKLKQNFSEMIPLQLNEKGDYMEALGGMPAILPSCTAGRGLINKDTTLEFQTAMPIEGINDVERRSKMIKKFETFNQHYSGVRAEKIPEIPQNESYEEFLEKYSQLLQQGQLPVGYCRENIQPYNISLKTLYCNAVSATTDKGIETYLNHIIFAGLKLEYEMYIIHVNNEMTELYMSYGQKNYNDYDKVRDLLIRLRELFKTRNDEWKNYLKDHPNASLYDFCNERYKKVFVVIDDMGAFEKILYQTPNRDSMNAIFELFLNEGKSRGVYFFAGFPSSMDTTLYYMQASKIFTGYNTAIHFGGQLDKQRLFTPSSMPLKKQAEKTAENIGYSYNNGKLEEVWQAYRLQREL
ncbi:MAG: type VII secretion protein EssC [Eubacterium sp.]